MFALRTNYHSGTYIPTVAYTESFRGGPKFCHNRVTSQINFMGSAKGTENRNSGRTPNTREKPAVLLPKLLVFVLHFFIFRVLRGPWHSGPPRYTSVLMYDKTLLNGR